MVIRRAKIFHPPQWSVGEGRWVQYFAVSRKLNLNRANVAGELVWLGVYVETVRP